MGNDGSTVPVKNSPMDEAVKLLMINLDDLSNVAHKLGDKMTPILSKNSEARETAPKSDRAGSSDLVEAIENNAERVSDLADYLRGLYRATEL